MHRKNSLVIYGCGEDEEKVFKEVAEQYGISVFVTRDDVSEKNAGLAQGCCCVSVGHKVKVTKPIILALKKAGVRHLSTRSVGYDHIDMQTATTMGMSVNNITYSSASVAEYTLMLIMMLLRNTKQTLLCTEKYDFRAPITRGKELKDMTVGILGMGQIGTAVAERLQSFGCHILAYDCKLKNGVTFDELLQESDVLTIHVPLNIHTHHMINEQALAKMKQGAFMVNTARGGVIDTNTLVHALENKKLAGVAVDVLEGEEEFFYQNCENKFIANPYLAKLQSLENVIITPHLAYYTERVLYDIAEKTIQNSMHFERSKQYG